MTRVVKPAIISILLMAALSLGGCGQGGSGGTTTSSSTGGGGSTLATTTTSPTTATSPTTGTAPTTATVTASTEPGAQGPALTREQLAEFNGKEGRAAYVAVDGVIYDVSASRSWAQGAHSRCDLGAMAGNDLSELIRQAPANMRSLLERMPVVGRLVP